LLPGAVPFYKSHCTRCMSRFYAIKCQDCVKIDKMYVSWRERTPLLSKRVFSLSKPLTFPSMTRGHPWTPFYFGLKSVVYYLHLLKKNCKPGVKENAEQKTRPRAPLSEAKLKLKRIVFCGSVLFYKCTKIILFPEVTCIITVHLKQNCPQGGGP
jgi:hypothetical protein